MSRSNRMQRRDQAAAGRPQETATQVVVHEQVQAFVGPLPHPSVLEGYNQVHPGAADRIICMAEREQKARHFDHRVYMVTKAFSEVVGSVSGLAVPVGGLYVAYRLGMAGMSGAAIASVLGAVGLMGARIVLAWRNAKKDSEPKQLDLPLER